MKTVAAVGMDQYSLLTILLAACTAYAFDFPHYSKDGYCPFISHIPLGRVSPHPDEHGFRRVKEGAVATYTCTRGYEIEGNVNRTCINSVHGLRWNGSKPRCVPRRCPNIDSIANGNVFEGTRFPGSRTVFACFPSHVLVGARFIACLNNWTWDKPPPSCVRACPLTPPVNNGRFNATFAPIGGVVEIICDRCHNYTVGRFLRCMDNGEFEQPFPNCRPMLCRNPIGSATGNIIVEYKCGSQACFDCPSGSVPSGDPNITCLENGMWSGPIPTCVTSSEARTDGPESTASIILPQMIGGCPLPDDLTNGDYTLRLPGLRVGESFTVRGTQEEKRYELDVIIAPLPPGVERTVPEGTVAVYNCNRGYSRRGNNMGACVAGHWMGDLPTCTEVMCPLPQEPLNAFGFYITQGTRYGNTAEFHCYDGYYSNQLPYTIMCQHDGTWNGTTPPVCKPISCGYPIIYDDVVLNGRDFRYNGKSPTIACQDSVDNSSAVEIEITCQPDGNWDVPPIACGDDNPGTCPQRQNCKDTLIYIFTGRLVTLAQYSIHAMVTEVVYQRDKTREIVTKGEVTRIQKLYVPPWMSCCERLEVGEEYLFVGNFNFAQPVSRGCRDIYHFSLDENGRAFYFLSNSTLAEGFQFCR